MSKTREGGATRLRWHAHEWAGEWRAESATERIHVPLEVYHQAITQYLASKGIERKTWAEHMRSIVGAWKRQCEEEERLQADLAFWKTVPGVTVVSMERPADTN